MDYDILEQEHSIKEESKQYPLIGDLIPIQDLLNEYENGSPIIKKKISNSLLPKYHHLQRVRGDGNCFFRAYCYGMFKVLTQEKERAEKMVQWAIDSKSKLVQQGFSEFGIEDFWEVFVEELQKVQKGEYDGEKAINLLKTFQNPDVSDYIVCYSRFLCSGYMKSHANDYIAFLVDYPDIETFCRREVEPMGVESDIQHITAITNETEIAVKIEYLDNSKQDEINHHIFPSDRQPEFSILYRPGHYDLLL